MDLRHLWWANQAPADGWLEWIADDHWKSSGFRIVHHWVASPRRNHSKQGCYRPAALPESADMPLAHYVGPDGLVNLLSFLGDDQIVYGPDSSSMREYLEIVRRLAVPNYEEARQYWTEAESDGYVTDDGVGSYLQEILEGIIEKYGPVDDKHSDQ